jgi:nucleotide-binding universal stress UspA family protein
MYKKVLVAYDGSAGAEPALRRAATLAQLNGASLTMVWVRPPLPHHALGFNQDKEENIAADEYFENLKQRALAMAEAQHVPMECVSLYGDAAHEIVQFAEMRHFDLIVVGQAGHSDIISRILGQTADRISETAKCDVLIVRRPDAKQARH